jgi:serine phosphatase RsbU (regulator of sigma subunit)/ketosteroid isomerase-like protein
MCTLLDASCCKHYFWRLGCISPAYSNCLLDRIELRGYDAPVAEIGRRGSTVTSEAEEKNRSLVHRFLMAHARGDLDALGQMLAPEFVDHSLLPGQIPGREGYLQSAAEQHAALSNMRYIIEYQATDGDMVISRLTMRAAHDRGPLFGVAPTGKEWTTPIIVINRVSGGKIAEEWSADIVTPFLEEIERQARQRERVEQDLRVAQRIQQASLPEEVPELEGWQINPYYKPAREVGGDFYDFLELDNGRLGLVVGDATGHGVPAALVMSTTCGMLRAVALTVDSPGEVLARVNEALSARIPTNMFVTCFYAILELKNGSLRYANAGHDLPYVRRGGDAEELVARGMPLGLMPGISYEEKKTILEAGEAALFYSDGLVEAHNPGGEMFGFPRLRSLVAEHDEEGLLVDFLMDKLRSFTGYGWEQEDDITLVTLQRSAR